MSMKLNVNNFTMLQLCCKQRNSIVVLYTKTGRKIIINKN